MLVAGNKTPLRPALLAAGVAGEPGTLTLDGEACLLFSCNLRDLWKDLQQLYSGLILSDRAKAVFYGGFSNLWGFHLPTGFGPCRQRSP